MQKCNLERKIFLVLVLASIPLSGLPQDLAKHASFRCVASPIAKVLPDLSKACGTTFKWAPQTAADVVVLSIKDKPVSEIMKRIAQATGAEWAKEEDGYRLTRSESLNRKQQQDETSERATNIKEALAKLSAKIAEIPRMDADAARKAIEEGKAGGGDFVTSTGTMRRTIRSSGNGTIQMMGGSPSEPSARAIIKLLSKISPTELAQITPSTRLVYSTQANRMQRQLPGNSAAVMNDYVAEQKVFAEVAGETDSGRPTLVAPGSSSPTPLEAGLPTKTLLVLTRFGMFDALNAQILVFDDKGATIETGFFSISPESKPAEVKDLKSDSDGPIPFSDLSKEFLKLMPSMGGEGGKMQVVMISIDGGNVFGATNGSNGPTPVLSPQWRERILNPDKFDPLSTVPSDLFLGAGDQRNEDLVACLPDSVLARAVGRARGNGITPGELFAEAQRSWELTVDEAEGWLVIRPRRLYAARTDRVDRLALGSMLRTLDAKGRLTLDDLAAYAFKQPENQGPGALDQMYMKLINPAIAEKEFIRNLQGQRDILKLYGTLNQGQRQTLGSGRSLILGSLTGTQYALVTSLVYNSMDGPQIQGDRSALPPDAPIGRRQQRMRIIDVSGLLHERTELLPAGVPMDGGLALSITNEEAVFATKSGTKGGQFFNAQSLGFYRAQIDKPELAGIFGSDRQYDRFQLAQQTNYQFNFLLARRITLQRTLTEESLVKTADAVGYEELPVRFRQQVQQASNRAARSMPMQIGSTRATGGPPPAP